MLASGMSVGEIRGTWRGRHGAKALTVPEDKGIDRIIYVVPIAAIAAGAVGVGLLARKWLRRSAVANAAEAKASTPAAGGSEDRRIDDELSRMLEDDK